MKTFSDPPESMPFVETLEQRLERDRKDFVATLRARFEPEAKGDFKAVIGYALSYGIEVATLADAFSVSAATISRWKNGQVVPTLLVRKMTADIIGRIVNEKNGDAG